MLPSSWTTELATRGADQRERDRDDGVTDTNTIAAGIREGDEEEEDIIDGDLFERSRPPLGS